MREHRRVDYYSLLFLASTVTRDSFDFEVIFTPKRGAWVLPASPFSTCDTPQISRRPHLEGEPCSIPGIYIEEE